MPKTSIPKKRMVVISDLHCGHEYGLTPPDWWQREDANSPRVAKAAQFQRELWGFYSKAIFNLKPIDILVVNGDCIDGKGERSGGVEQITTDRNEQIRMAREAIGVAEANHVRVIYGTRYHVGKDEDFESILADLIGDGASLHGHDFFSVNGTWVDVKHKIAGSSVPHGRLTALARGRMWNVMWSSEHERQPRANIIIRSHVHYFGYCGGTGWLGVTTPALCYNSSFGIRECEGLVDVGVVCFDFEDNGGYTWNLIPARFPNLKANTESL